MYPISQGRIINVAGIVGNQEQAGIAYDGPRSTSSTREEMAEQYVGWESEVQTLLKARYRRSLNAPTMSNFDEIHFLQHATGPVSKWIVSVTNTLPTFAHGKAVLLGDAVSCDRV